MRMRALLLATVLAAATAACSSEKADAGAATDGASAAAASSSADVDLARIASYELTMDKMDRFYAAQRNLAAKMKGMSDAEREAMRQDDASDDGSLDGMVRKIESTPAMREAIEDAGLSPKEYVAVMMASLQSGMAAEIIKMRPNDDPDSLAREMEANIDNVRFMQENEAELTKKREAFEAEMKAMGMDQGS